MRGREANKLGAPSADLLVCFPSRAHLTLMPKPICSPARPSDQATKRMIHHHHLKRLNTKGTASPLMWGKTKPREQITEPTSPKVTCAGQIKVRPKAGPCKSWQSVMDEIERIHNKSSKTKRPSWAESIGFKKDVMQFLTCLRNVRFDFRCFGAFPHADITSDDEEEEEEDKDELDQFDQENINHVGDVNDQTSSKTVFSKWFMLLQENQNKDNAKPSSVVADDDDDASSVAAPPPNALLLMRCRSAPAKSQFLVKAEDEEEEVVVEEEEEKQVIGSRKTKNLRSLMDEENRNNNENLAMKTAYENDNDYYKIASDLAKETWVVDGMKDLLSRSRSWKR